MSDSEQFLIHIKQLCLFTTSQAPSTLCLRLHTNMTRRARWWGRLGLQPQRGPIPSLIKNTFPNGGIVGQVDVMVARLYFLYYHRSQKLFMGEKAHLKKLCEIEKERERAVEQVSRIIYNYYFALGKEIYIPAGTS